MSNHTKAWAIVREVPDHELRTALIAATERILDGAEDLCDDYDDPGDLEAGVINAIEWRDTIGEIAEKLDCDRSDIDSAIETLQERPKPEEKESQVTPAETPEVRELKARVVSLEKQLDDAIDQNHELRTELDAEKARKAEVPVQLQAAVGDVFAMSRKLTQFCEAAGIKPTHIRITRTRARKKAS